VEADTLVEGEIFLEERAADYIAHALRRKEGRFRGQKKLLSRKLPFVLRLWSGGFTK
jgi:hypothetical protein